MNPGQYKRAHRSPDRDWAVRPSVAQCLRFAQRSMMAQVITPGDRKLPGTEA